jgi:hypothetical protein
VAFDGLGQHKAKILEVMAVVCKGEGITLAEMKSKLRHRPFAIPRQYAMYLCRELTGRSYPAIGQLMGDRDHTTILFGYRKVRALEQCNPVLARKLDEYRRQIAALVTERVAALGCSSEWAPPPPMPTMSMLKPTVTTVTMGLAA